MSRFPDPRDHAARIERDAAAILPLVSTDWKSPLDSVGDLMNKLGMGWSRLIVALKHLVRMGHILCVPTYATGGPAGGLHVVLRPTLEGQSAPDRKDSIHANLELLEKIWPSP